MLRSPLGCSDIEISRLCLGTMNFGPRTPESQAVEILDAAIDSGINFIDTANQYGGHLGVGTTETILGDWFASDPSRRDKVVLATKVYEPMSDDPADRGLSARHIMDACEASLKRLRVEHVDLYQMHHIDRTVPIDETWEAMERLITQGKVRCVGSSNFPGWAIARANERAIAQTQFQLVSEQSLFNLLERRVELEVLPACREYEMGLIPWSPLAGGLLAGRGSRESGRRGSPEAQVARERHAAKLGAYEALCDELDLSPSVVALAWLLAQDGVISTIIGPASMEQLLSVVSAPDVELGEDVLVKLDTIFPPQGEAPEAYAW